MSSAAQKKMSLPAKMMIALALGVVAGLIVQNVPAISAEWFRPFGDLFIRLIRMIVVPLVFCSIVSGATSTGDAAKLGGIAVRSIIYFLLTTVVAVAIGLVLANIVHPGAGITPPEGLSASTAAMPSIVTTLLSIVPLNPFEALSTANLLQVLFFAIFLGFMLSAAGDKAKNIVALFDEMNGIMVKMTSVIMRFAPIGVFAMITWVVGTYGPAVLLPLAKLIIVVYLACIIHICVVYLPLVKGFTKVKLGTYFRIMSEPLLIAFTTCASAAALPANMRAARRMGASKDVTSFAVPLGTTINMDGAAIYLGVASIFVAEVFGMPLTFSDQLTILLMSLLASIGSVGVPGAALVVMTMVFAQVGLPMEGIALVAGVDRVLDMARTTLNVMGDSTCAIVVSHASGEVDPDFLIEEGGASS